MQAKDIMTTTVITARKDSLVHDLAGLMLKHRISGLPIVDSEQRVIGIVSEGDLMRRAENETEARHAWWLALILSKQDRADEYRKAHGLKADDVMTRRVVTIADDASLREIANLLEKHHIKCVPVTRDGKLVGIVSRSNLLHGLAAEGVTKPGPSTIDDRIIREELLHTLSKQTGIDTALLNVIVDGGVVQLWGLVSSTNEVKAAQVAAETARGVKRVENNLSALPEWMWAD